MIEEVATVVSTAENGVWLKTTPSGNCNSCDENKTCGTGLVARALTPRDAHFFVFTELSLLPGEQVKIAVAEENLLKAAAMVYVLPVILLVVFAVVVQAVWQPPELLVILAAITGGVIGFLCAQKYNNHLNQQPEQVQIISVIPRLAVQQLPS